MVVCVRMRNCGWAIVTLVVLVSFRHTFVSATSVNIGIISEDMTLDEELALNFSLDYANRALLNASVQLVDIRGPPVNSEFDAIRTGCQLISTGVSALLAILSNELTKTIAITATTYKVPLLAPKTTNPLFVSNPMYSYLVRQSPPDSLQSEAIADVIKYFRWTRIAMLTSDSEYGVKGLVRLQNIASLRKWTVYGVHRFQSERNASSINATAVLRKIKTSGVRIIVLHCTAVEGIPVFRQASLLGMVSAGWQWIVTDGITSSDSLLQSEEVAYQLRGLLGTSITVPQTAFSDRLLSDWTERTGRREISSTQAVIMDAVFTIAYAAATNESRLEGEQLNCSDPQSRWSNGAEALLALTQVSGDGVMGRIEYEARQPKSTTYDIVSVVASRWLKIGAWRSGQPSASRLRITNSTTLKMGGTETVADFVSGLSNKALRVVFLFETGFLAAKPGITIDYLKNLTVVPSDLIEGYVLDLLFKLQELIGFKSSLYITPDLKFGAKDPVTGEWNGAVRELLLKNADLALTTFTVNSVRSAVMDFTTTFNDYGLKFVMKKREIVQDSFRFFAPFSPILWGYIGGTLFLVSFVVAIVNKMSPFDFHGGFIQEDHHLSSERMKQKAYLKVKKRSLAMMDFANSTWMALGSLLMQGAEYYSRSVAGKFTISLWFLLVLLVAATYTANLSAFLTQSRLQGEINSIEELAAQSQVQYGVLNSAATAAFFDTSQIPMFKAMGAFMRAHNTYVADTDAGIRRARAGDYAFIKASPILYYEAQKPPCELRVVGKIFSRVGDAFGLQKDSPFTEELSIHMTQLRERGFMEDLSKKWLIIPGGCPMDDGQDKDALIRFGVTNVLGVFYIVYAGMAFSLVLLIVEWIAACAVDVRHNAVLSHTPKSWIEAFQWRRASLWKNLIKDFGRRTRVSAETVG